MDLYHGIDIGVLESKMALCHSVYYIPSEPIPEVRTKGLINEMKLILTDIYKQFGLSDFLSSRIFHTLSEQRWLRRLLDRGILYRERRGVQYYCKLLISPQTHQECFVSSDDADDQ